MSNQGNGGILSKFQQRLRKIRLSRNKKYQQNQKYINEKVEEIRKEIRNDNTPIYRGTSSKRVVSIEKEDKSNLVSKDKKATSVSEVIVNIRATAKDRSYSKKKVGLDISAGDNVEKNIPKALVKEKSPYDKKIIKDFNDKELTNEKEQSAITSVSSAKKPKKKVVADYNGYRRNIKAISDFEKEELLKNLGVEIIDKIKSSFEDKLDELEVLESELYFLKKDQEVELELKKVKAIKKRIDELIEQVNHIIDQYNLYKRNYYLDNVIDIDDNVLVDDIINYRDLLDSFNDEKKFVKEYKALEAFKSLYDNLIAVRDDTEELINRNEEKIEEYGIRDKRYDDIKMGIVPIVDIEKRCSYEIEKQNEYIDNLMKKINIIDKEEYVTKHLKGIGDLISNSLRYMGFLMISPLAGLIPSIAAQTLMTKRMIGNAYRHLHIEEVRHVHYSAMDHDSELNHHLTDIDYTKNLLADTLIDVERLKEDFMLQYDSRIPGYEDTLKNIQKIENKLIRNQYKVEIIKKNLKKSKKLNENKMIKVRKLNEK